MPYKLTRKGRAILSNPEDLDDEKIEILWFVKENNEEPRGVTSLKDIVLDAGRGRETLHDVRELMRRGYLVAFEY